MRLWTTTVAVSPKQTLSSCRITTGRYVIEVSNNLSRCKQCSDVFTSVKSDLRVQEMSDLVPGPTQALISFVVH